jgi:hypothetical protein
LDKIVGIKRKKNYLQILKTNAVRTEVRLFGNNVTFMQNNNPKHAARVFKTFLFGKEEEGTLKILMARSPLKIGLEFERDKLDGKVRDECMTPKEYLCV